MLKTSKNVSWLIVQNSKIFIEIIISKWSCCERFEHFKAFSDYFPPVSLKTFLVSHLYFQKPTVQFSQHARKASKARRTKNQNETTENRETIVFLVLYRGHWRQAIGKIWNIVEKASPVHIWNDYYSISCYHKFISILKSHFGERCRWSILWIISTDYNFVCSVGHYGNIHIGLKISIAISKFGDYLQCL